MRWRSAVAGVVAALLAGCAAQPTPLPQSPTAVPVSPATLSAPPASGPVTRPTPSAEPSTTPVARITSVANFRDAAVRPMRAGLVYRSGRLADLTGADRARLVAVGVSDIFDLRTPVVAGRAPDPRVRGARYHLVNLFAVESTPFRPVTTVAAARAERIRMNRAFVSDPKQRARTAVVLRGIAEADGPVIIHCTEGKDRTGWVSAVLQLVAGADRDAVMADYLASNARRRKLIDAQVAVVRGQDGAKQAEIARIRLQVDRAYLEAGLDELKDRYGDLDGYLTEGLGLSRNTLAALRARLRG